MAIERGRPDRASMCSGGDLLLRGFLTAVAQSPASAKLGEPLSQSGCTRAPSSNKRRERPSSAPSCRNSWTGSDEPWRRDLRSSYDLSAPFSFLGVTDPPTGAACQLPKSRSQQASVMGNNSEGSCAVAEDLQKALNEHSVLLNLMEETCKTSFVQADEEREQMDSVAARPRQHVQDNGANMGGAAMPSSCDGPMPGGSAVYDGLIEKNELHIRKLLDQLKCDATVQDLAQRMRFDRPAQIKRLRQLLKHLADSLEVSDEAERRVARNTWELNLHAAALQASKAQCKALYNENKSLKAEQSDLRRELRGQAASASANLGRASKAEGRQQDLLRQIKVLKEAVSLVNAPATVEATPALRRAVQSLMRDNSRAHQVGRCAEHVHWRLKAEEKELRRNLNHRRRSSSMVLRHSNVDFDIQALEPDVLIRNDGKANGLKKQGTLEVIHPYYF